MLKFLKYELFKKNFFLITYFINNYYVSDETINLFSHFI